MELIVIDENRMKITLTAEEMSQYNIDIMNADEQDEKTKRVLYDILDKVANRYCFNTCRERALVKIFPSKDGKAKMQTTKRINGVPTKVFVFRLPEEGSSVQPLV